MAKGDIKNNENLEQCPKLRTHSPTNFLLQLKTNKIQIDKFKLSMSLALLDFENMSCLCTLCTVHCVEVNIIYSTHL